MYIQRISTITYISILVEYSDVKKTAKLYHVVFSKAKLFFLFGKIDRLISQYNYPKLDLSSDLLLFLYTKTGTVNT